MSSSPIIEPDAYLSQGGHVETYTDPASGIPYDYGVQSYIDYKGAKAFFARLNVSIGSMPRSAVSSKYADFSTGKLVTGYIPPNATAQSAALTKYLQLAEHYEDLILPGYWNFPSADRIPSDLLLDFATFAQKYGIEAAIPQMYTVAGLAMGDPAVTPTLYVMSGFGAPIARALLDGSTFVPASHNNSELFTRISTILGSDVLYSSLVTSSERSPDGVKLVVKNENGGETLIRAKRLLATFGPTLDNATPLDLDEDEVNVFSKWEYAQAFPGIATHPSLPINTSFINTPTAAVPSNYLAVPSLPSLARFSYIGSPGWRVIVGGDKGMNQSGAVDVIQSALDALIAAGTLNEADGGKLEFKAFAEHGAMHLRVGAGELRDGFVGKLYELQGRRGTWWTGAAWSAQYTSMVWAFTETVLPKLVEGL